MGYRDFVEDSDGDDAELEELQAVRFGVTASLGGHLTPGVISHEQWKDHTLFLIDASPSMCSRHPSDSTERTFLQIALQAVLSVLSRKLTRAKDKIGILLFGTVRRATLPWSR